MHRKGAQDKKRAKIFGRLIKELTVAARSSTDPDSNPRLRTALAAARAAKMPKDNIERVVSAEEPRVRLLDINIVDITERNAYRITLKYLIKESNREQDVEIILRRIR